MSEEQAYYKTVKSQDCLRTSIVDVGKYICKYNIHEWTWPKIGEIFVTGCLKGAIRTAEYHHRFQLPGDDTDHEVWKVYVLKPQRLTYMAMCTGEEYIEEFWAEKDLASLPNATLLTRDHNIYGCKAVKLEKLMRTEFGVVKSGKT